MAQQDPVNGGHATNTMVVITAKCPISSSSLHFLVITFVMGVPAYSRDGRTWLITYIFDLVY